MYLRSQVVPKATQRHEHDHEHNVNHEIDPEVAGAMISVAKTLEGLAPASRSRCHLGTRGAGGTRSPSPPPRPGSSYFRLSPRCPPLMRTIVAAETPEAGLDILADLASSDGDPRDLSPQQIPALRAMFEDTSGLGLYLFCQVICGCKDLTEELHLEICTFLSRWGELHLEDGTTVMRPPRQMEYPVQNWRRLMVVVPRDCFKTTVGTRSCALWTATRDPNATIGIFNESEANVKSWLGTIKRIVTESRLYQTLWPEVLPPGVKWNDNRSIPRTWKWGRHRAALRA